MYSADLYISSQSLPEVVVGIVDNFYNKLMLIVVGATGRAFDGRVSYPACCNVIATRARVDWLEDICASSKTA